MRRRDRSPRASWTGFGRGSETFDSRQVSLDRRAATIIASPHNAPSGATRAIGSIEPYPRTGSAPTSRAERWSTCRFRVLRPSQACEAAKSVVTLDHLRERGRREAVAWGIYSRE